MFKLLNQKEIPSLDITIFEYEHVNTKARHIHISADDKNNGFLCAFKTVPSSHNGVMHILEHSVLQGSKDFPLKDVFTSLSKQSLNTFMNAMTGPSYTLYPFTSQTKKDFFNLLHVYTNCVFFPLLRKEAFLQEGWRYEFEEPTNSDSKLKVTGVVYNEMIGALASPYRNVMAEISSNLYPDTIFSHESGGKPKNIPELSYEEFCDYHKKFYHPSNAIFVTYGDIPVEEHQEKLEELVLKEFNYQEVKIENIIQEEFSAPKSVSTTYPYKGEDFADKNFYMKAYSLTDFSNLQDIFTIGFLNSLISADSSSIMIKNLEKANISASNICMTIDYNSRYDLVVGVEGVTKENIPVADKIITDTFKSIAENGFEQETIEKELHQFELNERTKYHGVNNLAFDFIDKVLDAALNDIDISIILDPAPLLEQLKSDLQNPSFLKDFVNDKILNNNFRADVSIMADNATAIEEEKLLADIPAKKQESLSEIDKEEIVNDFKKLEAYQAEEDEEGILPELSVKDISLDFKLQELEITEHKNRDIYAFSTPTGGVTLYNRTTFIEDISASEVPYLNIYALLFDKVGFGDLTYDEAIAYESIMCDSLSLSVNITEDRNDPNKVYARASLGSKMLRENISLVKETMTKKLYTLRLDEKDKIITELKRLNSMNKNTYFDAGHRVALEIARSNLSKIENISIHFSGIEFTMFLKDLISNINDEDTYNTLIANLTSIHEKVVKSFDNYILAILDSKEDLDESINLLFEDSIVSSKVRSPINYDIDDYKTNLLLSNETSSNFCSMVIPAPCISHELAGAYLVLSRIIDGEYTHTELREKGGAYGGFASYTAHSEVFFLATFRDPNITKTFNVFKNFKNWISNEANITDTQIEEGILQAISAIDTPLSKVTQCSKSLVRFFDEVTDEDILNYREMVLKTDINQINRVINELILPNLDNAVFSGLVNKEQYLKEKSNLDLNTIEF